MEMEKQKKKIEQNKNEERREERKGKSNNRNYKTQITSIVRDHQLGYTGTRFAAHKSTKSTLYAPRLGYRQPRGRPQNS